LAAVLTGVPNQFVIHERISIPLLRVPGFCSEKMAAIVVAVRLSVADSLWRDGRGNTKVIFNGVDTAALCSNPKLPVIAYLGRLDAPIQIYHLVVALQTPDKRDIFAQFVMTGDASESAQYESLSQVVDQSALGNKVHIIPEGDEVQDLIDGVDVLALTRRLEGISHGLLGSIRTECPVVGYRVDDVNEVIQERENGVSVLMGGIDGLTSAPEQLVSDKPRRARVAFKAREDAGRGRSIVSQTEQYCALITANIKYSDAISGGFEFLHRCLNSPRWSITHLRHGRSNRS